MAPIKRPGDHIFDETSDNSSDEADHSSSASRTGSRKRRRTTNETSIQGDSDLEDPNTMSLDLDDEDALDFMATQTIQEKYATQSDNAPAESGILEEVLVENFMCHKHFRFPLGPLINFICGKNGSGKSAILTAITLCLGAKAASTNRGASLKKFIREGQENGLIQVKIKNRGDSAFMHEIYGDSIIVERHFSKSGASGFKIKSSNGRVISTKRATLDDICDHFSLQIDNPMNVLSQDHARQFISTSTPAFLYKQFMKGVQLEQLDQDYCVIAATINNIEDKLDAKRPDVEALKQRHQQAQNKMALFDRHEGLLDKIKHYRRQLAWIQVQEQEDILGEYNREIANADQNIQDFTLSLESLRKVQEQANVEFEEARHVYDEADAAVKQVEEEKKEEKLRQDEFKKEVMDAKAEQRNIKGMLQMNLDAIARKQREIEQEQQRLAERDGGGAAARLHACIEAKRNVERARNTLEEHRASKSQLIRAEKDAETELRLKKDAIQAQEEEVRRQQARLAEMKDTRTDHLAAFDKNMPKLLREIQQERGFAEKPVGPVGRYIRLLKPQWSPTLEKYFGGTLSSFIVTSNSDRNILSRIMNRVGCQCNIIIGKKEPLDTTGLEPDEAFDTPLRVLEIETDLVRNQLIIQHQIEQTILIADQDEAARILYNGPTRPRNVKRCFCIDSVKPRRGYMLSYTRNGEASQDAVAEYLGPSRIKTDNEAQLRLQLEVVETAKEQKHRSETEFHEVRSRHQRAKQAIVQHNRTDHQLVTAVQEAEDEVEQLNERIAEDNIAGGKLSVLQKQLADEEESRGINEQTFQDSVNAYDVKIKQLRESSAKLSAFDERLDVLRKTRDKTKSTAAKLDQKVKAASGDVNEATVKLNEGHDNLRELQQKRDDMARRIESYIAQATEVCPRINIEEGATHQSLRQKYEKLKDDYHKFERRIGISREDAAAEAHAAKEALERGENEFETLQELSKKLKASYDERTRRWMAFRAFISCRARATFTYFLSERSFRGKLITDHKQQLLELAVEPDITKRSGDGRGARMLSGGEKSFSQICLLLAIWEAMGSPIRCLDEFDVYMDSVNRNMSVKLLISAARQSKERQFILISPGTRGDLQDFRREGDIHVQEMPEPVRSGQRTLDEFHRS